MKTDELSMFLDSVDRFMKTEMAPYTATMDLYPQKDLPFNIFDKFTKAGILNREGVDGELLNPGNSVRLLSALSCHCAGIGAFVGYALAGEMLKKRYAPGQLPGGPVGICLHEEVDVDIEHCMPDFRTKLEGGAVHGAKKSVIMAGCATVYAVFASAGDGLCLAWVDGRAGTVEVSQPVGLLGIRAVPCADISFRAAPAIGKAEAGPEALLYVAAVLGLFNAACACATADTGLRKAWEYAAQRYQGGRTIGDYDAVELMYARNATMVGSSREAILAAADGFEDRSQERLQACIRAKINGSGNAVNALLDAIQMHGGYGYMRDYGIEKRFRDAVALSLMPFDNTRLSLMLAGTEARERRRI